MRNGYFNFISYFFSKYMSNTKFIREYYLNFCKFQWDAKTFNGFFLRNIILYPIFILAFSTRKVIRNTSFCYRNFFIRITDQIYFKFFFIWRAENKMSVTYLQPALMPDYVSAIFAALLVAIALVGEQLMVLL